MLNKLFGFQYGRDSVKTEILSGITTFLTMAYILAVNPSILSAAGMDRGAVFTTTILASVLATSIMSLYAKLPFVLAPGMGLNAFFAYTICVQMGYSWQFALTAVLIEGLIFILLTLTNLREAIVDAIPLTLKNAISVGIGLFIAFIGLHGGGVIVSNGTTVVALADITQGKAMLTCLGLLITAVMLVYRIRGAYLIGIILTTLIGIPMGITDIEGVFSTPPSIAPIFCRFEFGHLFSADMFVAVMTLLFVDMFDTIGTLVAVCMKVGMVKDGKILHLKKAFMADAIGTTAGAVLGTSTVTTFSESTAGIAEGGRTGLTSFTTVLCFLTALFLAPLFLSIPASATAPVLVLVGLMMSTAVKDIDFTDFSEGIPAFVCMIFMPFAGSISDGILLGVISYVVINLLGRKTDKLGLSIYVLSILFICKYLLGYLGGML